MLRPLLTFLALAAPAMAQEVDLSTLPPDYAFVSEGNGDRVNLRFIRREGARFLFEEKVTYADKSTETVLVWVNAQSQTIASGETGEEMRFTPHDCAPSVGTCLYTWQAPEDTFEMKSVTYITDGIWVADEYFKDGDIWAFWERDCTTYDEFGFWVDYVRIHDDGSTYSGARVRAGGNRLNELWAICQPPQLSS